MPITQRSKLESRNARESREADRTASFRDARNDEPSCPWIYQGFEEPPGLRKGKSDGMLQAGDLEARLRDIDRRVYRGAPGRKNVSMARRTTT